MSGEVYDVVVGAGVEGSAAAYYLAKRGKKTLLLEQFPLPHSRGSSHGQSRITRKAYPEDFYTAMMHEATDVWKELEKEAECEIYRQCGYLVIGPHNGRVLQEHAHSLSSNRAEFESLSPEEFRRRYPMLSFPSSYGGVLDPNGGILRADKALLAYQTIFKKNGGQIVDGARVTKLRPGSVVTIETSKNNFRGRSVILVPGPWAEKFLRPYGLKLPLQPVKLTVFYWRERHPGNHTSDRLPTFYEELNKHNYVYGLPSDEYPGQVKICVHGGPVVDPDARDQSDDSDMLKMARDYVREHFPQLEPSPSVVESCIMTLTPDKHPFLDFLPGHRNIVLGAGFSGHGFKLSPVVGKVLGQLACGERPSYSLAPFRIDRFPPPANL